jgi:geranylgeranyl diphosphate synthase, type II
LIKQNGLKPELLYEQERKKIEKKLSILLKNRKPLSLYSPGAYILRGGGKRIRPLLVLLSAKAVGGKFTAVYNAAVAVELLHNFTLVHDDIMDNADKRRGKPTLHKKYNMDTAILVGDSLLSIAYESLLKDCNGSTKFVMKEFTHGLIEVCEGQSLDNEFESLKNVSIKKYILMIQKKTAAMAELCCKLGAILGGGNDTEIKALAKFGRFLGIAFQIQDDLLDITGNELEFGKFVGGDLVEGKKTYLFLEALNKAKGADKKKLLSIIKNKGIKRNQIDSFKKLYFRLGIIDDAEREIQKYSRKALDQLGYIKKKKDREILSWLVNSLVGRSK